MTACALRRTFALLIAEMLALSVLTGWVASAGAARDSTVTVTRIYQSSRCAPGANGPEMRFFRDRVQAKQWLIAQLDGPSSDAVVPGGMAYIGLSAGTHATTGYGVSVSHRAVRTSGGGLLLQTRWARPDKDDDVLRMQITPCLLLGVPDDDYRSVRAVDQQGRIRVKAGVGQGDD